MCDESRHCDDDLELSDSDLAELHADFDSVEPDEYIFDDFGDLGLDDTGIEL